MKNIFSLFPVVLATALIAPLPAQEKPARIPAGYTAEKIETPQGVSLGVGGMEFAPDGSLMLCTREGEVWKYLIKKKQWSLFADGLHESLGLWIDPKTSETFVIQRGEITKLVDTNGDGRADLYKTFNADWGVTDNYHEYAFGLVRDSKGNFYGTLNTSLSWPGWARSKKWDVARVWTVGYKDTEGKMGRAAKYRGWCFKVTPKGEFEPFAAGLRSPAGIGINKDDELFFTDNQGDWEATSSLHHIVKGRFHGHPSSLWDHPDYKGKDLNAISLKDYEKLWKRPAVWIPHGELATSPGEPIFNYTGGKFGPFENQMFIGDQGRSNIMRVSLQKVGGDYQGVIFDFVNRLQTGCIRHVFAEDGSLWVGQTGRGWGSAGGKEFGLQRVSWDGKTTPFSMHDVKLTKTGFRITFTKPIDQAMAKEAQNYMVERWGYHYHPRYGSGKTNHKKEAPTKVTVAKDGLSLHLEVPLEEERVYKIILKVGAYKAKDGSGMANNTAWYTLNQLIQ
jgi:hypothetical protein